jgi:hypothetical protein
MVKHLIREKLTKILQCRKISKNQMNSERQKKSKKSEFSDKFRRSRNPDIATPWGKAFHPLRFLIRCIKFIAEEKYEKSFISV